MRLLRLWCWLLPSAVPTPNRSTFTIRRGVTRLRAPAASLRPWAPSTSAASLTDRGRRLFGLPLDAPLGRLLVEAEERTLRERENDNDEGVLGDMVDLVSALATGQPLGRADDGDTDTVTGDTVTGEEDDPATACDAARLVEGLRGRSRQDGRARRAPREVRELRRRLRRAFGLADRVPATDPDRRLDRRRLALTALAADPRTGYVARRRGRRLTFSNGGTEIELGRRSAANRLEDVEALVVLETRALGAGARAARTLVTCAMPVPLAWLAEAGLGRDRLAEVKVVDGQAVGRIERVHARRVLAVREEVPAGELARQALADLFLAGRLFRKSLLETQRRLRQAALARQIVARSSGVLWEAELTERFPDEVPDIAAWTHRRLATLGVESGADLPLLDGADLLPPALPDWVCEEIEGRYPSSLELAGAVYEIVYDLERRQAVLRQVRGQAHQLPPAFALPRLPGLAIRIEHRGTVRTLRE